MWKWQLRLGRTDGGEAAAEAQQPADGNEHNSDTRGLEKYAQSEEFRRKAVVTLRHVKAK